MRRILREPLVHFLLLGGLLFGVYGWVNRSGFAGKDEVVVTRAQVAGLVTQFERVWQRAPTAEEQRSLIDAWVRDEVFYREALAMGLDRGDPIVRRRMSQKVQFIVDSGTPAAPAEADLQAWLDAHADRYRREPEYVLQQVYFDPSKHRERTEELLVAAGRALAAGAAVSGDPTMLPARLEGNASDVARNFGDDFASALRALPVGTWHGPIRSAYGLHFVFLDSRVDGRAATLDEVRADVERDLAHERAQAASDAYYDRLRAKYVVRIEGGEAAPPAG
jgi:hypothetical protein